MTNIESTEGVVEAKAEDTGTGMTQEQLERWSAMSSEEQLEFFESESRRGVEKISFEEALETAVEATPDIEVQRRKSALVDVPFIIRNIKINMGQWGPFVTFTAVTQTPLIQGSDNNAVIVNDSSPNGLAGQVVELAKKHGLAGPGEKGILIKNGLRESKYYVDKDTRKVVGKLPVANSFPQSSFYLNL